MQQRRETNRDAGGDRLWPKVLIVLAFLMGLNGCFHDTLTAPRFTTTCPPGTKTTDTLWMHGKDEGKYALACFR